MAMIWQKNLNGNRYEVRSAGNTRRLYTNGVCHSEYNPVKISTGSVWDLLVLPAFFRSDESIKRVLVLGVGGGAVINQIMSLLSPDEIVGIELDPVHIYIARRFFKVENSGINLIENDAIEWLKQYNGSPFDMIIEDLFSEEKKEPKRVIEADHDWMQRLKRNLTPNGILVMNFVSKEELDRSVRSSGTDVGGCFDYAFQLTVPQLDNYVGVFLKQGSDSKELRNNLNRQPVFQKALQDRKLNYRIRKIWDSATKKV